MNTLIKKCTLADLDQLISIGIETYSDTFAAMNTPENMAAYLQIAFDREKIKTELMNPNSAFFFLYVDNRLASYLKVNEKDAQTDLIDENCLEIERIYVRREFQGAGLGRLLIEYGLSIAKEKKKEFAWLGVWEKNEKAIAFYEKMGFHKHSTHAFYMGDDRQTDYVLKKNITAQLR